MRISRRTSGGRGEYEISEDSPEGITPTDLIGRRLILDLRNKWCIDTGCSLTSQGGKRRIRMTYGADAHPHLQLGTALMMPHPVRADAPLGRGRPVIRTNQYAIEHIMFDKVELPSPSKARLRVSEVILSNITYHAEELDFRTRVAQIRTIWKKADSFPPDLSDLIKKHETIATTGGPIPKESGRIVPQIQRLTTESANDLGISFRTESEDSVPALIEALRAGESPPEPPMEVEEVPPEEVEIRRRTVKEWKRWANARGAASARFRQAVRTAYNWTCIVCGLRFPATSFNPIPGVDAAHILPWTKYDLDHISNGLCLCRHHHWAFDEGLIEVVFENGTYSVRIPEDIAGSILHEAPRFSIDELRHHEGIIAEDRLPADHKKRPNPKFLEMLRESD